MKHKKIFIDGKFIPQRMCISCRNVVPKEQLLRVAKLNDGTIVVNGKGGRGVYVCKDDNCIEKLKKTNGLSRGLKTNVPVEIYEECSNAR